MKKCNKCNETKDVSEFSITGRGRIAEVCNTCKEKQYTYTSTLRLTKYNLSIVDYDKLRVCQSHKCALCGKHELETKQKLLFVDHCHVSGKVRGLLCNSCNTGLGMFRDNIEVLKIAIKYLELHKPLD